MALTESSMASLGSPAPDFQLLDVLTGQQVSLAEVRGEVGTLVMFICNHCPYVRHVEQELRNLAADYQDSDIGIVAISANDAEAYPDDAPQYMAEKEYPFPYLYDETQQVARSYQATCTPDFFLYDDELRLVYRGQLDGSRPANDVEVTGEDLRNAMEALLLGHAVSPEQRPSMGCNIKWK
jgi:peroxiredoxin